MAKIRDLALTDISQIKKLLSFVDTGVSSFFDGIILPCPLNFLYKIVPLRFKFLPESFVLTDKNKIFACISIKKSVGNHKKWKISKLLMSDNPHEAGLVLIQYAISKFAAKGVHTFLASIEENQKELIQLLIDGAGFRHCSRQQLWRCVDYSCRQPALEGLSVRPFKNADAQNVCELFNESILPHFRPSLSKNKGEFYEKMFAGLFTAAQFRYVVENSERKQIVSYISLKTNDNKTFILDYVLSKGYEESFETILKYAVKLAQNRTKNPLLYVINKHYLQTAVHVENVLKNNSFEPSNSFVVLVKDLFKTVKVENKSSQTVFYTDLNSNPAFKSRL